MPFSVDDLQTLTGCVVRTVVICPCCVQPMKVVAKGQLKQYLLECLNDKCALYEVARITVRKDKIVKVVSVK